VAKPRTQYFYDTSGKQVGYAPAGTMEWDDGDGHTHWHFTDFASHRLLDATQVIANPEHNLPLPSSRERRSPRCQPLCSCTTSTTQTTPKRSRSIP
jgi:hypothetical protein